MNRVEWNDHFGVGIDKQHHYLVDTINHLCKVTYEGIDVFEMKKVFDDLEDYTHIHFSTEEGYFSKFDYLHTKDYIASHKDFRNDFLVWNKNALKDMISFLVDWLEQHFLDHYRQCIECFHKHGLF